MNLSKIVGVMGSGLIGTDPYEENAWSGTSRYFFSECDRQGVLHRAFGVEVSNVKRLPLILRNCSPKRDLWRQKFYLDTGYYDCLSRTIVDALTPTDLECALLQFGGIFNLKQLLPANSKVLSYHDGNLAQAIKSPHFPREIARSRVQRALDYERNVYHNLDMIFTMSDYLRDSFLNDFGVEPRRLKRLAQGLISTLSHGHRRKTMIQNIFCSSVQISNEKVGWISCTHSKWSKPFTRQAKLNIIGPRNLHIASDLCAGVLYHGFLSKKSPAEMLKFNQILNESSLFVMPSLYEPFGVAPIEAMAYEIPAILTDAWAFPEMVTPGINGELVKCGNVEELTEKIVVLLENPNRLREMGKAGRDLVLRKYTWQTVVSNLIEQISAINS